MTEKRCLYCYQILSNTEYEYHPNCSKKIFGKPIPPILDYTNDQMLELAEKVIQSHSTVTGVQAKLSLGLNSLGQKDYPQKLTIMGLWGEYILKPPSDHYPNLPELEDLTMHLAQISGISIVPHSLIRLKSGELAYLTKRIDRKNKQKFHMEDMCQLTERLTEAKYRGSYEQIGKAIIKFSQNPGLDIINFFEVVVFSFLTGNNDMHLKNFSLFKSPELGYILSPAYDLIAATLVVEGDDEDLALSLSGKKKKLKRSDFERAMNLFDINPRAFENIFTRLSKALPKLHNMIDISFLPVKVKEKYHEMVDSKAVQIEL